MPEAQAVQAAYDGLLARETERKWKLVKQFMNLVTYDPRFRMHRDELRYALELGASEEHAPLVLDFWSRFTYADLQSIVLVCALASGSADAFVSAIPRMLIPYLPWGSEKVIELMIRTYVPDLISDIDNVDFEKQREVIAKYLVPLARLAVFLANGASLSYSARLLFQIRGSYRLKLLEAFRQVKLDSDGRLDAHGKVEALDTRGTLFEATLFPGFVFSAVYLSGQLIYFLAFIPFILLGVALTPRVNAVAGQQAATVFAPIVLIILLKQVVKQFFKRVVHDRDQNIRHLRVYGIVFPALIFCNFIIGQLYGIARLVTAIAFSIGRCSRVDKLCAPQKYSRFDRGYTSFMCVVSLAAREYNPTKRVMLELIAGDRIWSSWYLRERHGRLSGGGRTQMPLTGGSSYGMEQAESGAADLLDSGYFARGAAAGTAMRLRPPGQHAAIEMEQDGSSYFAADGYLAEAAAAGTALRLGPQAVKTSRAKIRWHLALLLLRNPMLQMQRKQYLHQLAVDEEERTREAKGEHWIERLRRLALANLPEVAEPDKQPDTQPNKQPDTQPHVTIVSAPWQVELSGGLSAQSREGYAVQLGPAQESRRSVATGDQEGDANRPAAPGNLL